MTNKDTLEPLALLSAIVDSAHLAIYSHDLDGIITSWNRAAERMFGFTTAEVVGRPVFTIIPADRHEEERAFVGRVRMGHPVAHCETVRRRKDGTVFDVALTVSPIRDQTGAVVGISKIARDISEQKLVEYDARRLAALVISSDDAIIGKDLDGTIRSWNRGAERIFGYPAAEVLGKSIRVIIPANRKDEEDEVLSRVSRGEAVEHFETVRRRKDGTMVPISLTVSPIRSLDGSVIGASKIARDISEQKRAEQRAAFLSEAGKVLAASLDYEATLTAVANLAVPAIADWCAVDIVENGEKLQRLAVAHVDAAKIELARSIRDRYEDPNSPYSVATVVRTGTPVLLPVISDEMIVAAARGDQERIQLVRTLGLLSYLCVPLAVHGQIFGALSLVTAESKRLYGDDDLRFAQEVAYRAALAVDNARVFKEAQLANRLKDDFLSTLSHELRTPLNAMLGYARLLRSGMMTSDKHARALETLDRNATALTRIVEDVLDVSRIVSGKIRLDIQPVELPAVVRNAVETVQPAADAKQVRVQMILDPRAAPISGDPDRLQQIVWNLVSNAVKFTPKGGSVQVRLERVNSHVEIAVSDTGMGIAPDFLPHIFERFRQADSGTTREYGGLGLGLAIVRHLVELHGGTVTATSGGDRQGATFRVRLPVMIVHPEAAPHERRVHPRDHVGDTLARTSKLDGVHVLAVDDDADALALACEILASAGARVSTVDSAVKAIEQIRDLRPDVLIADIGLPIVDGFGLITRIRQLPDAELRDLPAAALTAYARSEDRVKSFQSGFQMHLAKPVDPAELVAAVVALSRRVSRHAG